MTPPYFNELYDTIECAIGENKFKSKNYIDDFFDGNNQLYDANCLAIGEYISGELNVSIAIRLLSGDDSLDLAVIFDIYPTHLSYILEEVLNNCIIKPTKGKIDITKYLSDKSVMNRVSNSFYQRSNGVLKETIGTFDA